MSHLIEIRQRLLLCFDSKVYFTATMSCYKFTRHRENNILFPNTDLSNHDQKEREREKPTQNEIDQSIIFLSQT
jgi:hypothetical protein